MTSARRLLGPMVIAGGALHLLVGCALWWHFRKYGGVLPDSDEFANLAKAGQLVAAWRGGDWIPWDRISTGETNPGYYFVLALIRFVAPDQLLLLRLCNVLACVVAIWLWWRTLLRNRETHEVASLFLVAALWIPSPMLWSALILKEAFVYALVAANGLVFARILRSPGPDAGQAAWFALSLLALSYFRNYTALMLLALSLPFMAYAKGWRTAIILGLGAAAAMLLLNPYLLGLVGQDVVAANAATSAGGSALPAGTSLWSKFWLFLSFPMPWQATSAFQKLAAPEVLLFLLSLPAIAAGIYLKLKTRDPLGCYVAAVAIATAAVCIVFVNNLGTFYRVKSSLMFAFAYFAAVGIQPVLARLRPSAA